MAFPSRSTLCAAALCLVLGSPAAQAEFPERAITMVVPTAAGGGNDTLARVIGQKMGELLGQTVIVVNKPGAQGAIAADYVARQPADGYTILMGSVSTHGSAPCVYSKLPYDALKDFTPLTVVATIPNVMSVNQSVPANNLREFVALLKKEPEKYSFASNGQGTSNHLAAELFKSTAGVSMVHVPYRGSGPALIDLVGGQINMMMDVVMTSYPYIKDGKIKALAVTSPQRSPMLPDVPTVAESGYPGYEAMVWFGMLAPAKLPEPLRVKLTDALAQTLHAPAMKTYLEQQGAQVSDVAGPAFGAMIKSEIDKWCGVVKQAGIKLD